MCNAPLQQSSSGALFIFSCGDTDLDDFFHNDAERYAAELMGKTYRLRLSEELV